MTNVYSAIPIYKRFFWPNPVVRFPLLWRKLIVGYNYEVTGQQNPTTCNALGGYFDANGIMRNADGSRSVFDNVDKG